MGRSEATACPREASAESACRREQARGCTREASLVAALRNGSSHAGRADLPAASRGRIYRSVPRISAFYGIIITMHWREHLPPHFHAFYAGADAAIAIGSGDVIGGDLPPRALRLVREWAELHENDLRANWDRSENALPLVEVAPLP